MDAIFCPVSNVFIEILENMWSECYRVLKRDGILMTGFMNPVQYILDQDIFWDRPDEPLEPAFQLPYNPRNLEAKGIIEVDPAHGYEFSHTLESQFAGQMHAGFMIVDFYESTDANNRLSAHFNGYLATLALKPVAELSGLLAKLRR